MITRPLLAVAVEDVDSLKYPQYATPKYDGIRCLIVDGHAVSRNFKPQPNVFIRTYLEGHLPSGLDGELVLKGDKKFNDIQSEVMSFEGEPDFEYHIFDYVKDDLNKPYLERMRDLAEWYGACQNPLFRERYKLVLPVEINNKDELLSYETQCLESGYEGLILRNATGKYKCGRSTLKEGILLKLKRFVDAEAEIIGFEERFHNANVQEQNEFGLSKRSSKKAGLVAADTLGALVVRDLTSGLEFNVGSGYDDAMRKEIWTNKEKYLNKIIKYKAQPFGAKEKPRFPIWLGFRSEGDM